MAGGGSVHAVEVAVGEGDDVVFFLYGAELRSSQAVFAVWEHVPFDLGRVGFGEDVGRSEEPAFTVVEHVLAELNAYSPLVTKGSYLVVFDTLLEYMPDDLITDRDWGIGNSPGSAVRDFLATSAHFEVDSNLDNKLLITVAPGGYLKRTEN